MTPCDRFKTEWNEAYKAHLILPKPDESVMWIGCFIDSAGINERNYNFGINDWKNNYNHGQAGVLYMYANDITDVFSVYFVPEVVVVGKKPAPGWFQDGVGPFGRIAYEIGGYNGIAALRRWDEEFCEAARVYITYDAPLSSNILSITEGLTGKATEGVGTFTDSERAIKIVEGLKEIGDLVTGGAGNALYAYVSSAVDHLIENYLTGETQKVVRDVKKAFDDTKDLKDIADKVLGEAKK